MKNTFTRFISKSSSCIVLVFLCKTAFPQSQTFMYAYGGGASDYIQGLQQTSDGGYILTGSTSSYGTLSFPLDQNIYVVKTDSDGNTLWSKTYWYGAYVDEAIDVLAESADSSYLILDNFRDTNQGNLFFGIAKLNKSGNETWNKSYSLGGALCFASTIKETDNGFLIGGSYFKDQNNNYDAFLMKTDSVGIPQWVKTYSTDASYKDQVFKISFTSDGSLLLTGVSYYNIVHSYRALVIKTDMNGNLKWTKAYASSLNTRCMGGYELSDGSYLFGGQAVNYGPGANDFMLFKTDTSGNVLWSKVYGDNQIQLISDMLITDDGAVLYGTTNTNNLPKEFLLKTDFDGNILSSIQYGDSTVSQSGGKCIKIKGGFALSGTRIGVFNQGYSAEDFTLMKTNETFNGNCLISDFPIVTDTFTNSVVSYSTIDSIIATSQDITFDSISGIMDTTFCEKLFSNITKDKILFPFNLYPNPSDGNINIDLANAFEKVSITIYNSTGKEVKSYFLTPSGKLLKLETNLNSGIYFYEIIPSSGSHVTGNFIVEK